MHPSSPDPVEVEAPAPKLRGLKIMVLTMGVLLLVGTLVLFAAIIQKVRQNASPNAGGGRHVTQCAPQQVGLPTGARILDSSVEEGKTVILHLGYVDGSEAWQRVDWCSGTVTASVTVGSGS